MVLLRIRALKYFNTTITRSISSRAADRIRNIGIIAHIDAGKTTTTERMLYYSGFTNRIGEVDDGSTVTDFLPAERARGITIQSAAITFYWPPIPQQQLLPPPNLPLEQPLSSTPHEINLIDTPGHADFTFEVLRSLRVLDGAVCILDGVAGVEAQTESVWAQAETHRIPRIIFINKLDRDGAAFRRTVQEIYHKLHVWPLVCQIPWLHGKDRILKGVGDVINLRAMAWGDAGGGDGSQITTYSWEELKSVDPDLAAELRHARVALIDRLSESDMDILDEVCNHNEDYMALSGKKLLDSIRKVLSDPESRIAPVFAGASFRNIGVQPLLDAVVDLLPSPNERPDPEITLGKHKTSLSKLLTDTTVLKGIRHAGNQARLELRSLPNLQACALAFKVASDPKRGVLVYVRVYHGVLTKNALLCNTSLGLGEKALRLCRMLASNTEGIDTINEGEIGVIVGLKHTRTGDTLLSYRGLNPKSSPPAPLDILQLQPIEVPPPVFYTAIEPNSLSEEKNLLSSLDILIREDPSLHVTTDADSGQTLLSGMGELHLEIACDRLINDFKAKAKVGKIQISYRETSTRFSGNDCVTYEKEVGGVLAKATFSITSYPVGSGYGKSIPSTSILIQHSFTDNNHLTIFFKEQTLQDANFEDLLPDHLNFDSVAKAITAGVSAALARGPRYRLPLHSTHIDIGLNPREFCPETTPNALASATREAATSLFTLQPGSPDQLLLEPVVRATFTVREQDMGTVMHDLASARGAQILSLDNEVNTHDDAHDKPRPDPGNLDYKHPIYAPPDPFTRDSASDGDEHLQNRKRYITSRLPLKEMVGYLNRLRSLTGGRGTFVMKFDGFEQVRGQRLKKIEVDLGF